MSEPATSRPIHRRAIELTVQLVLVGLLAYWCFRIFRPFLMPLIWGVILAVALAPLYLRLEGVLRGRRKLAAAVLIVVGLGALVVPAIALSDSVIDGVRAISSRLDGEPKGELRIPPAPASVADWPLVGPTVYETWNAAATSLETVLKPFRSQLLAFGRWLVALAKQAALAVLMTAVAVVIAAVLLVRRESAVKAALDIGRGSAASTVPRRCGSPAGRSARSPRAWSGWRRSRPLSPPSAWWRQACPAPACGRCWCWCSPGAAAGDPGARAGDLYVVATDAGTATVVLFTI
jgi:hypothetical protein